MGGPDRRSLRRREAWRFIASGSVRPRGRDVRRAPARPSPCLAADSVGSGWPCVGRVLAALARFGADVLELRGLILPSLDLQAGPVLAIIQFVVGEDDTWCPCADARDVLACRQTHDGCLLISAGSPGIRVDPRPVRTVLRQPHRPGRWSLRCMCTQKPGRLVRLGDARRFPLDPGRFNALACLPVFMAGAAWVSPQSRRRGTTMVDATTSGDWASARPCASCAIARAAGASHRWWVGMVANVRSSRLAAARGASRPLPRVHPPLFACALRGVDNCSPLEPVRALEPRPLAGVPLPAPLRVFADRRADINVSRPTHDRSTSDAGRIPVYPGRLLSCTRRVHSDPDRFRPCLSGRTRPQGTCVPTSKRHSTVPTAECAPSRPPRR